MVPELILEAYDHCRPRGDIERAVRIQYALLEMIDAIVFGVEFPEGVRVALESRGFRMGRQD